MRPNEITKPNATDETLDYGNFCKMIDAIKELLNMSFDGNDFHVTETPGGKKIALNKPTYTKDAFHLTMLSGKKIRLGPGLMWCPFQTGDPVTLKIIPGTHADTGIGDETDIDLSATGQFPTVYVPITITMSPGTGGRCKTLSSAGSVPYEAYNGAAGVGAYPIDFKIPGDYIGGTASDVTKTAKYNIPLYCFSAQVGSDAATWDNYLLILDLRYAPRFTHDTAGWENVRRLAPLPETEPTAGQVLTAIDTVGTNVEWTTP